MRKVLLLLIIFFCVYGCREGIATQDKSRPLNSAEIKNGEEIIREQSDLNAKRIYDIYLECKKESKSSEENKKMVSEALKASDVAMQRCKDARYSIPFKPDWGGREEYLSKVSLSDLMPGNTVDERMSKKMMRSMEKELKDNNDRMKLGIISEIEKSENDMKIAVKYKR